jgi:hypothetical protein
MKQYARVYFSLLRDNRKLEVKHDKAAIAPGRLTSCFGVEASSFAFGENPYL